MKNRVTLLMSVISILILIIGLYRGLTIGEFEILSLSELKDKNNNLNSDIVEASRLTAIDFPDKIEELEEIHEKYVVRKQEYEELVELTDKGNEEIYESKQYDIVYIWEVCGKYATTRNLRLGLDVKRVSAEKNLYNFNFYVKGEYVNISQFIADIENDSDLYFRIYNFKMVGPPKKNGEKSILVEATFTVKNINIDPSTLINNSK